MKTWVAVTDGDWFNFLRSLPNVDEVNFWQPGGSRQFTTLSVGQPLLFKLHYPDNFIVGGGFFRHSTLLPASIAWDSFREKNGAPSFEYMRQRIEHYRGVPADPKAEYTIGCILLQEPFFFARNEWIPAPPDFKKHTQQGKTYDLTVGTGRDLWNQVLERLHRQSISRELLLPQSEMFREGVIARLRLGQGTFRVLVSDKYQRRCAVTRERALPVLEAAHIRPVAYGGVHQVDNALLLRSDVHTLFDRGYVTITGDYRFRVSRRLKEDFNNGEHYYQLNDHPIWLPPDPEDRPSSELLTWHADVVFKQ